MYIARGYGPITGRSTFRMKCRRYIKKKKCFSFLALVAHACISDRYRILYFAFDDFNRYRKFLSDGLRPTGAVHVEKVKSITISYATLSYSRDVVSNVPSVYTILRTRGVGVVVL